ncbi:PP2C family protein-serine/threonine phosphatase [Sinomonas susongensis]|uniref:PP2C family protein-serine/threonine phosphatase n=1 Tax=Sinomonas susongensis TaxID=1324851 RepID=UPI001108C5C0|nr:PP2C family protein-serine/threonine phosphatase [Sinomonas susongensis]
MGKGAGAALMAATVRAALNAQEPASPAEQLAGAGRVVDRDLEATGIFVTVFHARLEVETGALTFADAGHGLNLVVRADGTREQLRGSGLPLGLNFSTSRNNERATLEPGDTLVSFTDGLLDLHGGTLEAFEEIAELVAQHRDPSSIVDAVTALITEASAEDDVTVLAVHRAASAAN